VIEEEGERDIAFMNIPVCQALCWLLSDLLPNTFMSCFSPSRI
jgi:hypothetical protein